ncbi:MAG: S-layer related protein (Precursor) [Planctomycetaceae bacterium]|nr:S-layer related protein (Precursor) [Planctomycetaceae bacterium]
MNAKIAPTFLYSILFSAALCAAEFEVVPTEVVLNGNFDRAQLQITTKNTEGLGVDITRKARLENKTPDVFSVSKQGQIVPLKDGEGQLRIHFDGKSIEIPVTIQNVVAKPVVSFSEDVVPVFTKAGCNQGACHATQYGQGGFKLSLLGYAPEQDWPQIVRDLQQRRISRVRSEDSLILKKATLDVAHGGGKRFATGSYEYEMLKAWIDADVPKPVSKEPRVVGMTVTPKHAVYNLEQSQQLRVVATYNDGTSRDVTHRAKYDSLGDSVAVVDPSGNVTAIDHGQAAIMIRYQGQAKVSLVLSPFAKNVDLASFQPNNAVDDRVKDHWQRLGVVPAALCSDNEFIRRAFLDSIGTLPKPERIEKFLADKSPNKRAALVDELLGLTGDSSRDIYVNEWSAYWTLKWGDLIRNNRNKLGDGGMWSMANWMRQSFRENKPMDQFVREIITAQGSIYANGPANYYKITNKPTDLAEATAQIFLGVRLQCAKCHHHPFEVYSQADYYGMAAFFTRVGTKSSANFGALGGDTIVKLNASGSIRHPRTGQTMTPTPLLQEPVDVSSVRDWRRPLAVWLTSKENKLFARNIVNRTWGYFMGSGLVEPIDDLRETNPASNPELLEHLAQQFAADDFDLRKLMRLIMTSRVYQLSSTPRPENVGYTRFYLHYNVKRLPAEVLLDAIDFACGTQEKFRGVPLGTRAIELPDPNYSSYFLDTLGRPKRVITCECERTAEPNLAQVLHIANGELVHRKLSDKNGRISKLISSKAEDAQAVTEMFMVTFCRKPSADEITRCKEIISTAKNRQEGLEDVLWALSNSREFLFNH